MISRTRAGVRACVGWVARFFDCFHLMSRGHGQDRKAPELSTVTVSGVVGVAGVAKARDSPTKTIKR
jgi:hypothetical protein